MYYRLSHVQQYMVFYIFWVACIESMYKIVCLRLPRVILHQCGFQKLFYQAQEITTPHAIASTEFLPGRKPSERDTFQHLPVYNVYDWHALTTTNERMAIQKSRHIKQCVGMLGNTSIRECGAYIIHTHANFHVFSYIFSPCTCCRSGAIIQWLPRLIFIYIIDVQIIVSHNYELDTPSVAVMVSSCLCSSALLLTTVEKSCR